MRSRSVAQLFLSLTLLLASRMSAQSYTYQSIDFPGAQNTYAYGINNAGEIVGAYSDESGLKGWKLSGGTFLSVPMPGCSSGHPWGINDSGEIVGHCGNAAGLFAFITDGSNFQIVAHPEGYPTMGFGISNAGTLVGNSDSADYGRRGFLYSEGVLTDLILPDTLIDALHQAIIGGINSNGTAIVGYYTDTSATRGFVLSGENVQFLSYPDCTNTSFSAINNSNQIVGRALPRSADNYVAFVFAGGRFTNINVPGVQVVETWPTGINNSGQIVGWYPDSQGRTHGFLANPSTISIGLLIAELDAAFTAGEIKNPDAYNGLRDKLAAAEASIELHNPKAAIAQLEAFQRQLKADNLLSNTVVRDQLIADAEDLQGTLVRR